MDYKQFRADAMNDLEQLEKTKNCLRVTLTNVIDLAAVLDKRVEELEYEVYRLGKKIKELGG